RAAGVRLAEDYTQWVDWERFSARQDSRIKMGGVVGRALYEGEVAEFIPLLRLGELVHVGKGAVFGMGKYRVELV
ncbi:MAG TPA: CRISPR system precrRNA processing endoribonuclease RAMP protein Cas6, partial [Desulfotomaculum sp.]|nr:CRISPR system precrRNA processing endoribonuclease RAMP protein Cas6 [Desulfotomaculum sp.]